MLGVGVSLGEGGVSVGSDGVSEGGGVTVGRGGVALGGGGVIDGVFVGISVRVGSGVGVGGLKISTTRFSA